MDLSLLIHHILLLYFLFDIYFYDLSIIDLVLLLYHLDILNILSIVNYFFICDHSLLLLLFINRNQLSYLQIFIFECCIFEVDSILLLYLHNLNQYLNQLTLLFLSQTDYFNCLFNILYSLFDPLYSELHFFIQFVHS